jgi:hypothetical protein
MSDSDSDKVDSGSTGDDQGDANKPASESDGREKNSSSDNRGDQASNQQSLEDKFRDLPARAREIAEHMGILEPDRERDRDGGNALEKDVAPAAELAKGRYVDGHFVPDMQSDATGARDDQVAPTSRQASPPVNESGSADARNPQTDRTGRFDDYHDLRRAAEQRGFHVTHDIDGTHNPNSLHYRGQAIDVRTWDHSSQQVDAFITQMRDLGLTVLDERTRPSHQAVWDGSHIHIQIPQRTNNPRRDNTLGRGTRDMRVGRDSALGQQ